MFPLWLQHSGRAKGAHSCFRVGCLWPTSTPRLCPGTHGDCQAWAAWCCHAPCPGEGDCSGLQEGGSRRKRDTAACSQSHSFLQERDFAGNLGQWCLKDVNYFSLHFSIFFFILIKCPANWKCQHFSLTFSAPVFKSNHKQEALSSDGSQLSLCLHFPMPLHICWEVASGVLLQARMGRKAALHQQRPA